MTDTTIDLGKQRQLELEIVADQITAASYETDIRLMLDFILSRGLARGVGALQLAEKTINSRRGRI